MPCLFHHHGLIIRMIQRGLVDVSPSKLTYELNIRGLVFGHSGCVIAAINRTAETSTFKGCCITNTLLPPDDGLLASPKNVEVY
jgi:hypothetical protein